MEETIKYETVQTTDSELMKIISDEISRDMRRYPGRFNAEDEWGLL